MNVITIAGTLGRDAELRHTASGDPVTSFSVADSAGKDKPTTWWRCSFFGKRGASLAPFLVKGQAVTVSGTVTEREYQKDGQTIKTMEVRVNDVALQGGRRESSAPQPAKPAPAASGFDDFEDPPF